jgi:hypothetical protein
LESKDEVFDHFRSLVLRLNNEHPNCLKAIRSDNETEFRNGSFDQYCLEHDVDQQFLPRMFLNRMELWNERITLYLRWLGRFSMSIGLLGALGPMLSAMFAIS